MENMDYTKDICRCYTQRRTGRGPINPSFGMTLTLELDWLASKPRFHFQAGVIPNQKDGWGICLLGGF